MATFKVILFMNSDRYGFTETYYWNSIAGSFLTCKTDTQLLVKQRGMLLGYGAQIVGVRFEDLNQPGFSQILEGGPYVYAPPGTVNAVDSPWRGLLLNEYTAQNLNRRSDILHFVPTGAVLYRPFNPSQLALGATWAGLLAQYRELLVTGQSPQGKGSGAVWSIRARIKPTIGTNSQFVTAVRVDAATLRYIVTAPPITNMIVGSRVHLHNFIGCTLDGLAGDTVIQALAPNATDPTQNDYTLKKRQCCVGPIDYNGRGTITLIDYVYGQIVDTEARFCRIHKVGRRFFVTRGKHGTRICH